MPPTWLGEPTPELPCDALSAFAFSQAMRLLEVARRHRFPGDDQKRLRRNEPDRLEILQQIVLQRIDRAGRDIGAPLPDAERVAVRRRARDAADADCAAGAGHVLYDDRLTERCAHALGHQPCDHVGRAARGERHDHGDRPRRIGLGIRVRDVLQGHGANGSEYQLFHVPISPLSVSGNARSVLTPTS